jgi:hypothetical protein
MRTLVIALVAVSALSACAKKEAAVVVVDDVTVEPTYTGKYK